jgi:hypothetical protein
VTILDRIDATLDNRCPCGAPPRPGSAYCGYDCEPTHIAADTDTRDSGHFATPMRWRPDLVNATDDTNLNRINGTGNPHGYTGRYNASVYEYTDRPGVWHLRLDNGHRYVGLDITEDDVVNATDFTEFMQATWSRLERELDNTRHLEADDDPWADSHPTARELLDALRRRQRDAELDRRLADQLEQQEARTRWAADRYAVVLPIVPPVSDPRAILRNLNVC